MSPFSVQEPAALAQASPRRITAAKMRAASLLRKIGWEADPEQQILREVEVPLECEAAPCPWAHEPATGSALFRAILCLGLVIFLQSEGACHQRTWLRGKMPCALGQQIVAAAASNPAPNKLADRRGFG